MERSRPQIISQSQGLTDGDYLQSCTITNNAMKNTLPHVFVYVCESSPLPPPLPPLPSPAPAYPGLCFPSGQLLGPGRRETNCHIWWWPCERGLTRENGDRISWPGFKKEST